MSDSWPRRHAERRGVFLGLISKVALIPDRPFIVEKRLALRIPVARHLQLGRLGKVVLDGPGVAGLGLLVEKKPFFFTS